MTNNNEKLSEDIEILIAMRLMGEISKEENLKLEIFFQENPEIKKSYIEKEGVKRLLLNAAANLEELQLPLEKRNQLFKKISFSNSGRAIFYTYAVAASVFFSFIIGLYFYANNAYQTPEIDTAYNLKEKELTNSDSKKADLDVLDQKIVVAKEEKEEATGADKLKKKSKEESTLGGGRRGLEQADGARQNLKTDAKDEIFKKAESIKPSSNNTKSLDTKPVEYAKSDSESKLKSEKISASSPLSEEIAADAEDVKKSLESKLPQKSAPKMDKQYSSNKSESKEIPKFDQDELAGENYAGKPAIDEKNGKSKGGKDEKSVTPIIASSNIKNNEYSVEISFNNQLIVKKIISSTELINDKNTDKKSIRHYIDLKNLFKSAKNKDNDSAKKAISQVTTISENPINNNVGANKEKDLADSTKEEELRRATAIPGAPSAPEGNGLLKELALIHTCYHVYLNRTNLAKNVNRSLLEEIKKSLISISIFKEDADIKAWLSEIENELKP